MGGQIMRWLAAVMVMAGLAACNHDLGPAVASSPVLSDREMRLICEDEATARYGVGRRAVEIGAVRRAGDGYFTEGRLFRSGAPDRFFECRFGPRGGYRGFAETGTARPVAPAVSNREMRAYCEAEAARRYSVSRRAVDVGAVQAAGRGYRTEGRVRLAGRDAYFACRFGPNGGFDGLAETSRSPSGGGAVAPVASNAEMRQFCEGEAAKRYGVRRGRVNIGAVRARGNGYRTEGRIRNDGRGDTVFECRFGPRGGFSGMVEVSAPPPAAASRPEMRQACRQEAARRYNVPAGRVEIAPVQQVGSNFTAKGQTRRQGQTVVFECAFSARGALGAVRQLSP
ncbi:MAG: YsaB family lipoprotein [Pseudomonadota bacterium]